MTTTEIWQTSPVFLGATPFGLRVKGKPDGAIVASWTGVERGRREVERPGCLWDFIQLRSGDINLIEEFLLKWGLPSDVGRAKGRRRYDCTYLVDEAVSTENALRILIATVNGQVVPELPVLSSWGLQIVPPEVGEHEDRIAAQRHLLTEYIRWSSPQVQFVASWREGTRSTTPVVEGFDQLLGEELRTIFANPHLDIHECTVCLKIFPFDPAQRKRRPRHNAGVQCSDECRYKAQLSASKKWRQRAKPAGNVGSER